MNGHTSTTRITWCFQFSYINYYLLFQLFKLCKSLLIQTVKLYPDNFIGKL